MQQAGLDLPVVRVVDDRDPVPGPGQLDRDHVGHRRPGRVAQHHDPVGQQDGLVDAVGDHDHDLGVGLALPQLDELGLEPGPGQGVEGAERLVEQQHPGLDREGPRHGRALLHAAGHLVGSLVAGVPQADRGEVVTSDGAGLVPAPGAGRADRGPHVVEQAQTRQQRVALEHHGAIGARSRHRLTVERHRARVGRYQPAQHLDQRRLATAGVADERDELTRPDRQVDAPEHPLAGTVVGEALPQAGHVEGHAWASWRATARASRRNRTSRTRPTVPMMRMAQMTWAMLSALYSVHT